MNRNSALSEGIKCLIESIQILIGENVKIEAFESMRNGIASLKAAGKHLNPDVIAKLNELETRLHTIRIFFCTCCNSTSECSRLNCGHLFCDLCLTKYFQSLDNANYPNCKFKCPSCQVVHNTQDMQRICANLWKGALSDAKSYRETNNIAFNCGECEQQKSLNYFPEVFLCSTHKTCKECLATYHRNSNNGCKICRDMFNELIVKEKGVCMGCNEYVYYVGDYLTSVCGNHYHCFNCLQKLKVDKCCLVCCNQITEKEIDKINRILDLECSVCRQVKPSLLFVNKTCCESPVCSLCQMKNGYNCIGSKTDNKICNAELGLFAIQLIEEMREQVEKMNLC